MSDHDKVFMNTFMAVLAALAILAFAFYFIADFVTSDDTAEPDARAQAKIEENIQPVGQVNVGAVAAVTETASAEPRTGDQVYNAACLACHASGVAGAPKVGDKAAWSARAAQGIDTLLKHAINGLNAMPPKGTCADCSDDELKAAIEYMLKETGV